MYVLKCAETLTWCDVAAILQIIMSYVIPQVRCARVVSCAPVSVMWICGDPTQVTNPIGSNTARVKFTRRLAFCQCGGTGM